MSNDALFDEIEQFLADGGEPAEPTPEERMAAALAQFADAIKPMMDAFAKAIQEFLEAIKAIFRPYVDALIRLYEELQRNQLSAQLESWWVPAPVARWIAARWLKRWLPALVLPPPEIM